MSENANYMQLKCRLIEFVVNNNYSKLLSWLVTEFNNLMACLGSDFDRSCKRKRSNNRTLIILYSCD